MKPAELATKLAARKAGLPANATARRNAIAALLNGRAQIGPPARVKGPKP